MRKGAGAVLGPLLLVALTVAVAAWSMQTSQSPQYAAAGLRAAKASAAPTLPTVLVQHPRASRQAFEAGVSVVVYGNDPYFQYKTRVLLNRLAGLNVNSVSMVIPIFQAGTRANVVAADPVRTPTDARITFFIAQARRQGFTVMLRPLLDIGIPETPNDWRGTIRADDPVQWRESYRQLILSYARLAQANHAELYDIGSELDSIEPYASYWQSLIADVRGVFHGQLTYSSNWAKGYPAFGSRLDLLSIDAYFPLARPIGATTADLATAWQRWIDRMTRFSRLFGKPLLLTELGATAQVGSFQQPWLSDNGRALDLTAQQRYYQAACASVVPKFKGVYWWLYTLDPPATPLLDRGFAIAGKPAESDLKACFAQLG